MKNIGKNLLTMINGFINVSVLLSSFILGCFGSILIIALGCSVLCKLVFLLVGGLCLLYYVREEVYIDDKPIMFRHGIIMISLAFLIMELGLFIHSGYTALIPVKTIVTNEDKPVKNFLGEVVDGMNISYKKISFYSLDNNKLIDSIIINNGEDEKLKLMSTVTFKEVYIKYTPFLVYSKEFRYIRSK